MRGCVRACVCGCGCVYVAVRACAPADGEQLLSTANIVLVAGTSPSAEFHDLGFGEAAQCSCCCGSGSDAVQWILVRWVPCAAQELTD